MFSKFLPVIPYPNLCPIFSYLCLSSHSVFHLSLGPHPFFSTITLSPWTIHNPIRTQRCSDASCLWAEISNLLSFPHQYPLLSWMWERQRCEGLFPCWLSLLLILAGVLLLALLYYSLNQLQWATLTTSRLPSHQTPPTLVFLTPPGHPSFSFLFAWLRPQSSSLRSLDKSGSLPPQSACTASILAGEDFSPPCMISHC